MVKRNFFRGLWLVVALGSGCVAGDDLRLIEATKESGACRAVYCPSDGECINVVVPDGSRCSDVGEDRVETCVAGRCRS